MTRKKQIKQNPETQYHIEQWVKSRGDKNPEWMMVVSPLGERLHFVDEQTAQQEAAKLSVMNNTDFRVIAEDALNPESFMVFSFGQRYRQSEGGGRVRHPLFILDEDDGEPLIMFVIQTRQQFSDGSFGVWSQLGDRRYADYALAIEAVIDQSQDEISTDYRVVSEENLDLPPVVYRRGVGRLDAGRIQNQSAEGVGQLLYEWAKGSSTDTIPYILEATLAALEYAGDKALLEKVSALTGANGGEGKIHNDELG